MTGHACAVPPLLEEVFILFNHQANILKQICTHPKKIGGSFALDTWW
jgi:hypothetical protein